MKYKRYLNSKHWATLRGNKLKECPSCVGCEVAAGLHVHHINYRDLFSCTLSDLAVLCNGCHRDFHEAIKLEGKFPKAFTDTDSIKDVLRRFRSFNQQDYTALRVKRGLKPKALHKVRNESLKEFTRLARMTIRGYGRYGYTVDSLQRTVEHIHRLIKARKELDLAEGGKKAVEPLGLVDRSL